MATDMDIEMDIDIGLPEHDLMAQETEILPHTLETGHQDPIPILSPPNDTSDPQALEPVPHKVHLRGLEKLNTNDIRAFASEYYGTHEIEHVEWIDDNSANLVYETADIARDALIAFASMEVTDASQTPVLQALPAKSFPSHPNTTLQVRIAVVGDRKQAGAHQRSRFYLMNPEYDPAERRKRGNHRGGRTSYRDREDGGYRSQRYDDREQQKRELESEFDSTLYDDDEVAIAKRAARRHVRQDSTSGGDSLDRGQREIRTRRDRELFPERGQSGTGRLRNRSASPTRDSDFDRDTVRMRRQDAIAAENRSKAKAIKARLRDAQAPKELFPDKTGVSNRRFGALQATDEIDDLFANKMPVPFMDGSTDERSNKAGAFASTLDSRSSNDGIGFSIRGLAKSLPGATSSFSIKGAASGTQVKELFPSKFGANAGKELFSETLEGRGGRRQKADLFF